MHAALWVFTGKLANQAVTLFIVMILARLLTPEDFGIVAASQVILIFSQIVVRFGIGAYLIQAELLTPRIISTAQTLMLSVALLISAILWLLAVPIGNAINVAQLPQIMPVLLASFILSAVINPSASLLSREMEFKFLAKTEISSQAIGYGAVTVVLALLGFGFWAIIFGTFMQTLIRAVLVFRQVPVWPNLTMKISEIMPMLRFGGGVFLAQLMSNTAQRVDNLIITATIGPAALGYYSRAYSLMEISNKLIGSVFQETLFSGFSKKRREDQRSARDVKFLMAHTFAAFIIIPISALMWLLADEIIWVVLGSDWASAVPILKILSLGMFFRLGYKVSGALILATGIVYRLAILNFVYAGLVAAGASIGVRWGITGVAWGVFGALVIHFLSMTTASMILCGANWRQYAKQLSPFLLAGTLASTVVYGIKFGLSMSTVVDALVAATTFVAIYIATIYMLRHQETVQPIIVLFKKLINIDKKRVPQVPDS